MACMCMRPSPSSGRPLRSGGTPPRASAQVGPSSPAHCLVLACVRAVNQELADAHETCHAEAVILLAPRDTPGVIDKALTLVCGT